MRGIYHRADGIHCLSQCRVILPYGLHIRLAADNSAEDICRDHTALFVKSVSRIGEKILYSLPFRIGFHIHTVICRIGIRTYRESHIIILDLIKTQICRHLRKLCQIFPDLLPVGIYPGQSIGICHRLTVRLRQCQFRLCRRQNGILKAYDPRNGIYIMIFQFLHHCLNVPDVTYSGLHFGYPVQHGNVLWNLLISQPERQISLVVFHVDDHGIQFRLIHQADQIFHSATASLRAGDVDSLYLRPSRHAVRRSLLCIPGGGIPIRDIRCILPGGSLFCEIHRGHYFYSCLFRPCQR